jgi:hypothetical protein
LVEAAKATESVLYNCHPRAIDRDGNDMHPIAAAARGGRRCARQHVRGRHFERNNDISSASSKRPRHPRWHLRRSRWLGKESRSVNSPANQRPTAMVDESELLHEHLAHDDLVVGVGPELARSALAFGWL